MGSSRPEPRLPPKRSHTLTPRRVIAGRVLAAAVLGDQDRRHRLAGERASRTRADRRSRSGRAGAAGRRDREHRVLARDDLRERRGIGDVVAVDREHDVVLGEPEILERAVIEPRDDRAVIELRDSASRARARNRRRSRRAHALRPSRARSTCSRRRAPCRPARTRRTACRRACRTTPSSARSTGPALRLITRAAAWRPSWTSRFACVLCGSRATAAYAAARCSTHVRQHAGDRAIFRRARTRCPRTRHRSPRPRLLLGSRAAARRRRTITPTSPLQSTEPGAIVRRSRSAARVVLRRGHRTETERARILRRSSDRTRRTPIAPSTATTRSRARACRSRCRGRAASVCARLSWTRPVARLLVELAHAQLGELVLELLVELTGGGRPGRISICASLAVDCIVALQLGHGSSGAVANFSTARCSATSIERALA